MISVDDKVCKKVKWIGPCLKSKCSDSCERSGYMDGICEPGPGPIILDICFCLYQC